MLTQLTPKALSRLMLLACLAAPASGSEKMSEPMKQFVEKEARYLLTPDEKKQFLALEAEEARRTFVDAFWRARDPSPSTPENEFRDEHLQRMEAADRLFAEEGVPGWKTDRGRTYILYGPPDRTIVQDTNSVEMMRERELRGTEGVNSSQPRSGSRVPFYADEYSLDAGRPQMLGKEVWYYSRPVGGVADWGGQVVFRKTPSGRWVVSSKRDPNRARPFDRGLVQTDLPSPPRAERESSDRLAVALEELELKALDDMVREGLVHVAIPAEAAAFYLPAGAGESLVPICLQFDTTVLDFEPAGADRRARLQLFGVVLQGFGAEAQLVRSFSTPLELMQSSSGRLETLAFSLTLPPGDFRLFMGVLDAISTKVGTLSRPLTVPDFDTSFRLSSILLARRYREKSPDQPSSIESGEIDLGGFALEVEPRFHFDEDDTVEVFFQVAGAKGELSIDYRFFQDGRPVRPPLTRRSHSANISQPLPLSVFALEPGTYRLVLRVEDLATGEVSTGEAELTIRPS